MKFFAALTDGRPSVLRRRLLVLALVPLVVCLITAPVRVAGNLSCSPSQGPREGGVAITVWAYWIGSSQVQSITFGTLPAAVQSTHSGYAMVTVPSINATGVQDIQVTVTATSTNPTAPVLTGPFTYRPPPVITSCQPSQVSISGTQRLTIIGNYLGQSGSTTVTIFGQSVTLSSVSQTSIELDLPTLTAQQAGIPQSVATYSQTFGSGFAAACFTPMNFGTINEVFPSQIPITRTNAMVTIYGQSMLLTSGASGLQVQFCSSYTCTVVTAASNRIVCTLPTLTSTGSCRLDISSPGSVSLSCTNCLTILPAPLPLAGLVPNTASYIGRDLITIRGQGAIGSGSDVVGVLWNTAWLPVVSQTASEAVVIAPYYPAALLSTQNVIVNIVVRSLSLGDQGLTGVPFTFTSGLDPYFNQLRAAPKQIGAYSATVNVRMGLLNTGGSGFSCAVNGQSGTVASISPNRYLVCAVTVQGPASSTWATFSSSTVTTVMDGIDIRQMIVWSIDPSIVYQGASPGEITVYGVFIPHGLSSGVTAHYAGGVVGSCTVPPVPSSGSPDSNQFTCTIPSSLSVGNSVQFYYNGAYVGDYQSFQVKQGTAAPPPPPAGITGVTPASVPMGLDATLTLSGSGFSTSSSPTCAFVTSGATYAGTYGSHSSTSAVCQFPGTAMLAAGAVQLVWGGPAGTQYNSPNVPVTPPTATYRTPGAVFTMGLTVVLYVDGGPFQAAQNISFSSTLPTSTGYASVPAAVVVGPTVVSWQTVFTATGSGTVRLRIHGAVVTSMAVTVSLPTPTQNFTLTGVQPTVIPMLGLPVTINGAGFLSGMSVLINGVPALNVTVLSNTTLTCTAPPLNSTGYLPLLLVYGSLNRTFADAFYYTSDCPMPGMYGVGLQCVPCPAGGYCPGGNRVWPLPGWWNYNEFSGMVSPCYPPIRCLGGRFSTCADGYRGDFCAQCEDRYYESSLLCYPCGDQWVVILLLFAQFVFLVLLALVVIVGSDAIISNLAFILMALRIMWIVTYQSAYGLPGPVQSVLHVLGLLAGDLSFAQPACTGVITSFGAIYGVNVGMLVAICLLVVLVLILQSRLRIFLGRRRFSDKADPRQLANFERSERRWLVQRITQALCVLFAFSYEVVAVKALQGVNCRTEQDRLLLMADRTQECFTGSHVYVFVASVLLIVLLLAFPVYLLWGVVKYRRHSGLSPVGSIAVKSTLEEFHPRLYFFGLMEMILLDLGLAFCAVFIVNRLVDMVVETLVLGLVLVLVILRRTFVEWFKNVGFALVLVIGVLSQVSQYLVDTDEANDVVPYMMVILMFAFAAGVVLVMVLYLCVARCVRMPPLLQLPRRPELNIIVEEAKPDEEEPSTPAASPADSKAVLPKSSLFSDTPSLQLFAAKAADDSTAALELLKPKRPELVAATDRPQRSVTGSAAAEAPARSARAGALSSGVTPASTPPAQPAAPPPLPPLRARSGSGRPATGGPPARTAPIPAAQRRLTAAGPPSTPPPPPSPSTDAGAPAPGRPLPPRRPALTVALPARDAPASRSSVRSPRSAMRSSSPPPLHTGHAASPSPSPSPAAAHASYYQRLLSSSGSAEAPNSPVSPVSPGGRAGSSGTSPARRSSSPSGSRAFSAASRSSLAAARPRLPLVPAPVPPAARRAASPTAGEADRVPAVMERHLARARSTGRDTPTALLLSTRRNSSSAAR